MQMFSGCTSLTGIHNFLSSATLCGDVSSCFEGMFSGCTNLSSVPDDLLQNFTHMPTACCKNMFRNCKNLVFEQEHGFVYGPALPATQLCAQCYMGMFAGCKSLKDTCQLPATELAPSCYMQMFMGAGNNVSYVELPAPTLIDSCYREMFSGCDDMACIITEHEAWLDELSATHMWLENTNPIFGMFECPSALGTQDTI